ncbi:hypothetical protein KY285_020258 [Solanum tuberosum]|nr:hypothetical protein KY289_020498 [Solanum tuberosum]KAH0693161.1 hypothetical protein KY285_020258 [Solanum tuberosum]
MTLNIQGNNLTRSIPSDVGRLKQLQGLYPIFQGHIAEEACHLSNFVKLTLDDNELTGVIPECIGYLSMLQNSIEGEVPLDIGGLKAIVELDLSYSIPLSFAKLISLEYLDLSLNALSGEIPNGGVFVNSTLQSFFGNMGLCGMHILEVPTCSINNLGKQSKFKELMLKIITPVVISSLMILLLISFWIMKRKKKGKSKDVEKSLAHTETLGSLGYIAPGTMMDVVDANIFSEEEQITSKSDICLGSIIELALDCTKEMPESRITMKDVVKRLNKINNARIFGNADFGSFLSHSKRERVRVLESEEEKKRRKGRSSKKIRQDHRGFSSGVIPIKLLKLLVVVEVVSCVVEVIVHCGT